MKKLLTTLIPTLLLAMPLVVLAQQTLSSFVSIIIGLINVLIVLIIAMALLVFLWGVFNFIRAEGEKKEEGRKFIIWGLVGLFVMFSVWGLLNVLVNTFGLNNSPVTAPIIN